MFRVNLQMTTAAAMSANGNPGGTGAVVFIDTALGNALSAIGPDGTIYTANKSDATNVIVFVAR